MRIYLLAFIALGLFGDELFILEVVNTHSVTYLSNRLLSYLASSSRTRSQNIIYALNILLIFSTSLAHRFEAIVEHIKQEFLAGAIAQTSAGIMILQRLEIGVIRQETCKIIIGAERIQIGEDGVALQVTGLLNREMLRVGVHRELTFFLSSLAESER